jgi:hypothetical protein
MTVVSLVCMYVCVCVCVCVCVYVRTCLCVQTVNIMPQNLSCFPFQ